jgi:hypothetical protein
MVVPVVTALASADRLAVDELGVVDEVPAADGLSVADGPVVAKGRAVADGLPLVALLLSGDGPLVMGDGVLGFIGATRPLAGGALLEEPVDPPL